MKLQNFSFSIIIIICVFSTYYLHSQQKNEQELEALFENISKETTNSEDLEKIDFYSANPLYLLYASASDIADIPGISQISAIRLNNFIQTYKNQNLTYKMLDDSLNLSVNEFLLLLHCTSLDKNKSLENFHKFNIRARSQNNFQTQKGFSDSSFQGSKLDLYQRIKYNSKNVSASFLTDKSAGEKYLNDFMSGGVSYKNEYMKLVLGDFTTSIGMGTLLWRQFGASKGSEVFYPATQTGKGANLYSSSLEFNFFRGLALNYKINSNYEFSAGISNVNRAATIDKENNFVSSIYNAGYFRTETEISKRNTLNESMGYVNLIKNDSNSTMGAVLLYLNYDKEINGESSSLIDGKGGLFGSIFYSYFKNNFSAMAEFSSDNNQNIALKSNFTYEINNLKMLVHPRYFSKDFRSMFGYNFGEFSYPSNEYGIYSGIQLKISNQSQLAFYFDKYSSIGRTFSVPFIVSGADLFAEYRFKQTQNNLYLFRLKYESKTQAITDNYKNRSSYPETKFSSRIDLQNKIGAKFTIRERVEAIYSDFSDNKASETGFACFLDMNFELNEFFDLGGRIAYYSTDSYDSAIWQYEYSIPGIMATSANYGKGTRFYMYMSFMPIKEFAIRMKYAKTQKNNISKLSSGLNEINGNIDERLYIQLDCNF